MKTKIDKLFSTISAEDGSLVDYKGSELPYSPKWSGSVDAQYSFPVGDELNASSSSTKPGPRPT